MPHVHHSHVKFTISEINGVRVHGHDETGKKLIVRDTFFNIVRCIGITAVIKLDARNTVVSVSAYQVPKFKPLTCKAVTHNMKLGGASELQIKTFRNLTRTAFRNKTVTVYELASLTTSPAQCIMLANNGNEGWGMQPEFWSSVAILTHRGRKVIELADIPLMLNLTPDSALRASFAVVDGCVIPSMYTDVVQSIYAEHQHAAARDVCNIFHAFLAMLRATDAHGHVTYIWSDITKTARERLDTCTDVTVDPTFSGQGIMLTLSSNRAIENNVLSMVNTACREELPAPVSCHGRQLTMRMTIFDVPGSTIGIRQWLDDVSKDMIIVELAALEDMVNSTACSCADMFVIVDCNRMPMVIFNKLVSFSLQFTAPVVLLGDSTGPRPSPMLGWGQPWTDIVTACNIGVPRVAKDFHVPRTFKSHSVPSTVYSALSMNNASAMISNTRLKPSMTLFEYPDDTSFSSKFERIKNIQSRFGSTSCAVVATLAEHERLAIKCGSGLKDVGQNDVVRINGRYPAIDVVDQIIKRRDLSNVLSRIPLTSNGYYAQLKKNGCTSLTDIAVANFCTPTTYCMTGPEHIIIVGGVEDDSRTLSVIRDATRTLHFVGCCAANVMYPRHRHTISMFNYAIVPRSLHVVHTMSPALLSTLANISP